MFPNDAKTVTLMNNTTDVYDLSGNTSDITILQVNSRFLEWHAHNNDRVLVNCDSDGKVFNVIKSSPETAGSNGGQSSFDEWWGQQTCVGGVIDITNDINTGSAVTITYVERDMSATGGYTTSVITNGPTFYEFLFVMGVVIFMLTFSFWKRLFKPIEKIVYGY